jgi:phosphatidylglycerophosphatase A
MPADAPAPPVAARADALSTAVATALWSGYFPIAPGTVGSAVGLVLFVPLLRLSPALQLAAVAALFIAGVVASTRVARGVGIEDPGIVVVDEVLGMWTSLLFLPFTPATAVAAFFLFRILDVFKPYPARQLESLPGGWGIMSDDLIAGVYANLLLRAGLLAFGA